MQSRPDRYATHVFQMILLISHMTQHALDANNKDQIDQQGTYDSDLTITGLASSGKEGAGNAPTTSICCVVSPILQSVLQDHG